MKQKKQRTVCMPIKEYNLLKRKREQLLKVRVLIVGALDLTKKERSTEAKALLSNALRTLSQVK